MKVFSHPFNIYDLKVALTEEICELQLDTEMVSLKEKHVPYLKSNRLPILQVDPGQFLFLPNAICRYVLSRNTKEVLTVEEEEWIEWEAKYLEPLMVAVLQCTFLNTKVHSSISSLLLNSLKKLNTFLNNSANLHSLETKPGLTAIILWSTLYPIASHGTLSASYLVHFEATQKWYQNLSVQPAFQTAVKKVFKGSDLTACKECLLTLTAPVLPSDMTNNFQSVPAMPVTDSSGDNIELENENYEVLVTADEVHSAFKSWQCGKEYLPRPKKYAVPILPQENERNILITSALPYVNNIPHLGNIIGSTLSADVFARYCRLRGHRTFYVCGTDEYGTATETKALEEGVTPEAICDKYHKIHCDIYQWFNISFDYFGRTTTEMQTKIAQDIFWRLYKQQYLFEDSTEQLFCQSCSRFLADRFVEGICPFCQFEDCRGDQCDKCGKLINTTELRQPRCKICRATPCLKSSRHLFLDLPKLDPQLRKWFNKATVSGHWTTTAKVISQSWLRDGLKPRCITRDLKWGTPVPLQGFTDKVFYVWFDAPIGYLSMTATYTDQWEKWWKSPHHVQLYQFMAKDNVPFHSIIFPASQLGADDNYTVVNNLVAVEYLNYEDTKFSKSRGVGVFGTDAMNTGIPSDVWRFYLLYLRPESQDTSFSWNDLMLKNNSELLNNLGNFFNRALAFLQNNFAGIVPEMSLTDNDKCLLAQVTKHLRHYLALLENTKLRDGIRTLLCISRLGNQYIQTNKPWVLIKGTPEERNRAGTVMGLAANIVCLLATLIHPYMPDTSQCLRSQLNSSDEHHVLTPDFVCLLPPGHVLGKPSPIFKKIEQAQVDQLKMRFSCKQC